MKKENIFKKNGELNLSELSKLMGHSPQKLKSDLLKIKNSLTEEAREKNRKQYEALVLGGLAMYAGITKDDFASIIKEGKANGEISTKISRLKELIDKFDVSSWEYTMLISILESRE